MPAKHNPDNHGRNDARQDDEVMGHDISAEPDFAAPSHSADLRITSAELDALAGLLVPRLHEIQREHFE
ncbi:MAG: hypothetical protein AAGK14_10775 [Verrucomicrobiota bacterium]